MTLSTYETLSEGNYLFKQIPLIEYDIIIIGDFGTQTYQVNTEITRAIRIETVPLYQLILFVFIGLAVGALITGFIIRRRR